MTDQGLDKICRDHGLNIRDITFGASEFEACPNVANSIRAKYVDTGDFYVS